MGNYSAWFRFYYPCGRFECFSWACIIVIFAVITFLLSLVIAMETFNNVEQIPPLRGSGSSFAFSLYDEWFNTLYVDSGLQVSYQTSTPSEGLFALQDSSNSYTFAGGEQTSLSYNTTDIENVISFPIVGASVALLFNVPEIGNTQLLVSMDTLLQIYNGTITTWDDPLLVTLNTNTLEGATLPNEKIIPLHFFKENGATFILSTTFSSYSPWWNEEIGSGERVTFPPVNNAYSPIFDDYDMLETLLQVPYSIGYSLYPSLSGYNGQFAQIFTNFTLLDMCTVVEDGICSNNVSLNAKVQSEAIQAFTIQSNGIALPPPFEWNCNDCWFFNGYTYWYTSESYPFQSGCSGFLSNLETLLSWVYTDPLAAQQSDDASFVLQQGTTFSILEGQIDRISCVEGSSKILNRSLAIGWIAVCLIAVLFFLIICVRLSVGVYKKHQRLKHSPISFSLQGDGPLEVSPLLMKSQIDKKDIILSEQIGTGSFGEVYKGLWHGTEVAVKRMLLNTDNQRTVIEDFFQEANLMSTLRHPNVIQFLGASLQKPHLYIVLELAERGSVFDLLAKNDCQLDWRKKINFCIDAAKGMLYLHSSSPPIMHRDLKTANLLVDQNWKVKVTDFGLSRVVDTQSTMTHCGTVEFCAPEVLKRSRYSTKADVYSFGICMWQIFTRSALFHNTPLYQLMRMVIHDRYRPPMDDRIFSPATKSLVERCWAHDPEKRPEFDEILRDLIHILHKSTY